jgi:hypothetical protein
LIDDQSVFLFGNASDVASFGKNIRNDLDNFIDNYMKVNNITNRDKAYEDISNWLKKNFYSTLALSDLIGGTAAVKGVDLKTDYNIHMHKLEYWQGKALEHETFATFVGQTVVNNQNTIEWIYTNPDGSVKHVTQLEAIKEVFPDAYKEFEEMAKKLTPKLF